VKPISLVLFFALLTVTAVGTAAAGEKTDGLRTKDQEVILRVQKALEDTVVDTKDFAGETTLAKVLAALEAKLPAGPEARLPAGNKITIRIDEEAFGKQFPQLRDAPLDLPVMKNVSLLTVLRKVLAKAGKVEEVDYGIRPTGVIITRPRLAAHTMAYDVRHLVPQTPLLVSQLQRARGEIKSHPKPGDGLADLVQLLTESVDMRPWETIEVFNKTRLVVSASPTRQAEVDNLLEALRRLADVAVVMNARLYEVDRAFFTKNVAPLFDKNKEAKDRAEVVAIDGPLFKKITRQTVVLESEDVKLRPHQTEPFLSRHSVFRYAAGPTDQAGATPTAGGTAGVSFEVRPLVSPDRRFLRLEITQKVAQLVKIDKAKVLDPATGKDVEVDSPNVRHTSATGTVDVPDSAPILMVVGYRPAGKENEDKVWLMVARPFIWIEEEVREIRRTGGDVSPRSVWSSPVPEDEKPTPATPLPFNNDVSEILQAVVKDVLTNPALKDTRDFYGTAADKTFALVDNEKLGWPKEFKPDTHGYKLVEARQDPFVNGRRVLGIRIDKFDLKQRKVGTQDTPIQVCVFNTGGSANGAVIGGCTVYYAPKRVGKRWAVEYDGLLDP
jgi:hypothetical protein